MFDSQGANSVVHILVHLLIKTTEAFKWNYVHVDCFTGQYPSHVHTALKTDTHTCISERGGAELAHRVNLRSPVSMSHIDTSLFPWTAAHRRISN